MTKTHKQTVFIVDDDDAVRDSIQELLESVGLRAEGHPSGQAFLDAFEPERPGCLILDVRMAGISGLAVQERLNALGATMPIIMLTAHGDVPMAVQAIQGGAVDFLQKPYRDQALLDSVNRALELDVGARQSGAESGAEGGDLAQGLSLLTQREREVFDNLLKGSTSKEIARELDVSHRTIEAHRQNLLRKLGLSSVKELLALALASRREH
jgi:FixJ family two-component response regulator